MSFPRFAAAIAAVAMLMPQSTFYSEDYDPPRKRWKHIPDALRATEADLLGKSHGKSKSKRAKRRKGGAT